MIPVYIFDCIYCINSYKGENCLCCGAYPNGIPEKIIKSELRPSELTECKNGYKFEDDRIQKNC